MLKTQSKKIGDLSVTVTQFAGRKNLSLLVDMAAFVAPSLAGVKGGGKSIMDMDIDIPTVVNGLVKSLDSDKVMNLVSRLLGSTFINEREMTDSEFDIVFAGQNLMALPKVLVFVIEVNYGNFSKLVENVSSLQDQRKVQADQQEN